MTIPSDHVFDSALETARACFRAKQDELAQANAIIADLRSKLAAYAPELAHHKADTDDAQDRHALNAFLDKAGYRRQGDLVYLTPRAPSCTSEVRSPEKAAVATIVTETKEVHIFKPWRGSLDRFRKNPIVLYNHDYEGLPVARSLWERVRDGDNGPELVAKPQFHMDTELSREVWAQVERGHLCAWELGVVPARWEACGDAYLVTAWDILEYSVVPRSEDLPALREERRLRRISSPALVKSIMEEGEVDIA